MWGVKSHIIGTCPKVFLGIKIKMVSCHTLGGGLVFFEGFPKELEINYEIICRYYIRFKSGQVQIFSFFDLPDPHLTFTRPGPELDNLLLFSLCY